MGSWVITTISTLVFLVFFFLNITLANDVVKLYNQANIIKSKHGPEHTNTLESIIELCNLYEITNNSLPLFCLNCGNGRLEPLEQCDDGNNFDYDGCNADCSFEVPPLNSPLLLLGFNV